jgi:hypothetical protein
MMVFSESSKFWKTSGLSTFCTPVFLVSLHFKGIAVVVCERVVNPYSCSKLYILLEPVQEQWRKEPILVSQSGSLQPADPKGCIHRRHMFSKSTGWKTSRLFCWGYLLRASQKVRGGYQGEMRPKFVFRSRFQADGIKTSLQHDRRSCRLSMASSG